MQNLYEALLRPEEAAKMAKIQQIVEQKLQQQKGTGRIEFGPIPAEDYPYYDAIRRSIAAQTGLITGNSYDPGNEVEEGHYRWHTRFHV